MKKQAFLGIGAINANLSIKIGNDIMLLHKKHGFHYTLHGNWAFFINFAQSNTIKTLLLWT